MALNVLAVRALEVGHVLDSDGMKLMQNLILALREQTMISCSLYSF
jgi:hypothetical protein